MNTVDQIMSQPARTCAAHDPLTVPAQTMWDRDVGCVVVVDSGGTPVGVVTDRDVCMAAYTQGKPLDGISVETAMAHLVHSCGPRDSIRHAMAIMREHRLRRLPVVDAKGHVVGLLSIGDVLRTARNQDLTAAAEALAKIVTPRQPRGMVAQPTVAARAS